MTIPIYPALPAYLTEMRMRSLPSVVFKVEKWNSASGSKEPLDTSWFRIKGIPREKGLSLMFARWLQRLECLWKLTKTTLLKKNMWEWRLGAEMCDKSTRYCWWCLVFSLPRFSFSEGSRTDPADNKWIRTRGDKASDDNSSPKNPRLWGGFQTDDTLARPSRISNSDKERQGAEGINKDQLENSKEDVDDREDEGLQMGDSCPPGVGGLIFGNFDRVEIWKLNYI